MVPVRSLPVRVAGGPSSPGRRPYAIDGGQIHDYYTPVMPRFVKSETMGCRVSRTMCESHVINKVQWTPQTKATMEVAPI